jgi:2'-5' RNA ligase
MRLFLAIELPDDVRKHLARVREAVEHLDIDVADMIRWVKPQNWHITLKFLGEVNDDRSNEVITALRNVRSAQLELMLSELIYLPPNRGPVRVVACGIGGDSGRLNLLHRAIESACESVGFESERRRFTPHATIGRSPDGFAAMMMGRCLRRAKQPRIFPGPKFTVTQFVLMQSLLKTEGAEYVRIAQFPLEK